MGYLGIASEGELDTAKAEVIGAVAGVKAEVTKRPDEAKIAAILNAKFGTPTLNLSQEMTNLGTQTGEIKTAVTTGLDPRLASLEQKLSEQIRKKRDSGGIKRFLLTAGVAAIPAVAYWHENGLDALPMLGNAGAGFQDIAGSAVDLWNKVSPVKIPV